MESNKRERERERDREKEGERERERELRQSLWVHVVLNRSQHSDDLYLNLL
jgi:hypothetical protein